MRAYFPQDNEDRAITAELDAVMWEIQHNPEDPTIDARLANILERNSRQMAKGRADMLAVERLGRAPYLADIAAAFRDRAPLDLLVSCVGLLLVLLSQLEVRVAGFVQTFMNRGGFPGLLARCSAIWKYRQ